ncbi:hypothetical protein [Aeromonas dhakensis]|uniref:hypothetical protein n=1 Tax=Aeromonas dhakensis TaxID=196024 RepID=UPI003BA3527D
MNTSSPTYASQDRTSAIVYGVVGSLIATALVAGGAWLAQNQVPDETALQYAFSENRVGNLSTWYIRVSNSSDVAFDVELAPPSAKIVRFEFMPKGDNSSTWKGQIAKGHTVDSLFVIEDSDLRLSPAVIQSVISATYQERNPLTGAIENRTGEVRDSDAVPLTRTILLIFWFLLPILSTSLILLLPKGWKWLRQRLK